jgi:hypothetical protein
MVKALNKESFIRAEKMRKLQSQREGPVCPSIINCHVPTPECLVTVEVQFRSFLTPALGGLQLHAPTAYFPAKKSQPGIEARSSSP